MPTVTLTPPRRLEAPRFRLRPWSPADAPRLAAVLAANDAHLRAWIPHVIDGRVPGQTLAERLAMHAESFAIGREWQWAIVTPADDAILGGCGLYPRVGPGAVELGYWLARSATGQGIATATARLLTDAALAEPGISRVEIRVEPANAASVAVPRRLGYRHARTIVAEDGATLEVWEAERRTWTPA